jgi:hypothetical protein
MQIIPSNRPGSSQSPNETGIMEVRNTTEEMDAFKIGRSTL